MKNSYQKNGHFVLVVDDSPDTLGMLNEALEKAGMTTLVALDGNQAIKIASQMQPDIILLDAIMPNMDGFETCKRLKMDAELKNTPVIFMTGLSDTESVVNGFEAGGVDYLTKPINSQELIARINRHLINARATQSAQNALDSVGQNIFSVNAEGKKIWSTPAVNRLLAQIDSEGFTHELENRLAEWITHTPEIDNKLHFDVNEEKYTAIYFGLSEGNKEHLIRLVKDGAANETQMLQEHFSITKRESEVYLWLAKGKTNREIAQILEMSPRTVNKHLEQLFKKIDVDNRTTAASKAIQYLQKKMAW